jgi:hypothetical protein
MQDYGSECMDKEEYQTSPAEDMKTKSPVWHDEQAKLILDEEREVGVVKLSIYASYLKSIGNPLWIIMYLLFLALGQVSFVANVLFLGFWSGGVLPNFSQSNYMTTYASESTSVVDNVF